MTPTEETNLPAPGRADAEMMRVARQPDVLGHMLQPQPPLLGHAPEQNAVWAVPRLFVNILDGLREARRAVRRSHAVFLLQKRRTNQSSVRNDIVHDYKTTETNLKKYPTACSHHVM